MSSRLEAVLTPTGNRLADYASMLLKHGFVLLNFGAPLEPIYREQEPHFNRVRNRFFLTVGFFLVLFFDAIQPGFTPDVEQLLWSIRIFLLCPLIALALVVTYSTKLKKWEYSLLALTNFANSVTVIFTMYFSHSPEAVHFHSLLMLSVVYGCLLQRLPFWYSLAWIGAVFFIYVLSCGNLTNFNKLQEYYASLFVMMTVAGLAMNYVADFRTRNDFLQSIVVKSEKEMLEKTRSELYRAAIRDVTTGLYNRRHFDAQLAVQWRKACEEKQPIALLFIDVDCFKRFNDCYGHQAGDECLRNVAEAIVALDKGPLDVVARYGGEEFVVLMPAMNWESAVEFAERVRISIASLAIPHKASMVAKHVTVSIGVAVMQPVRQTQSDLLIQIADDALYQAKREGRNRVCCPGDELERA